MSIRSTRPIEVASRRPAVSGTLTNTVVPAVLHKPYPNHAMPYYEPVKDTTEVKTFYAGTGYWTGGTGSLTATYQWQRSTSGGFVNISGETGESYVRTAADSGASIRCVVTVNGKAANTNPVSIPAAPSWPSTTLINTTFGGALPFEWPSFWAALQAADAASGGIELIHLEGVKLEPAVTRGMLRVRKTGSYPTLNVPIAPNAPAGTYDWEVEIGGGYFPTSWNDKITGDIHFKLRDASGAVRGDATLTIKKEDVPTTISARGTFRISGADKSVHLYVIGDVGTGGTASALGGPVLSKLKIWQP